jgi:peptide chain release factor subunit 1
LKFQPNVAGLILAGSAAFKTDLASTDMFDQRLKSIIIKIVDVSYGGENGFNQAIELSSDALANVKFIHEKKLLSNYMSEIAQDTGLFGTQCFFNSFVVVLREVSMCIVYRDAEGKLKNEQ